MNSTNLIYVFWALAAGSAIVIQSGANTQLRNAVGSPSVASLISFVVGSLILLVYAIALRAPVPGTEVLRSPFWIWAGGLLGAFFVISVILLAPKLGATLLFTLVVGGQLVASIIVDQFGLLGYAQHPLHLGRVIGIALVLAGAFIVRLT